MTTTAPTPSPASGPVRTRLFWTWDHCTEWALNRPGAQTIGASNPYFRSRDSFVADYTRLLKWCGQHGIDGVVVWGLLRDVHGGIDAARQLCDVARECGVRLLAGAGINAYGGVYYQGNSPYSLAAHLEKHPDLYAVDPNGAKLRNLPTMHQVACPSRPENQDFAVTSLRWLFEQLPTLGGVQIESGDTGMCQCRLCRDRRQFPAGVLSWEDMAMLYPMTVKAIRAVAPDAWIACETYSHPEPYAGPAERPPGFGDGKPVWADACLAKFPDDILVQWVADFHGPPRNDHPWTDAAKVNASPRHTHLMRAHFGTHWMGNIRGELALDWIAAMVQRGIASGCTATSLFGEVSPFNPSAELNYLALANLGSAANPTADINVFRRDVAAPLLGGVEPATAFAEFARRCRQPARIPDALTEIRRRMAGLDAAAARRWTCLAAWLASFAEDAAPAK
ncbi:MAG: hypothetical protein A3K19_04325 [Lentisphaerae bacterium RIFOXYB12_FULL_65_16]|nr:MAG: hypothetical protein A3K18_34795 [Lentisphaerae bacterium RIFOXYA12_64_32]OGV84547.1 MAG: hypothetical protein A3K19_04325 [Lentisphaerae bacterium RIFOXYB12_FULL_65_16]